ncbi:MAG: hypothetical protein FWE67_12165, partial [Planctomycetaceae bacterium]|nr:hypothetical protein [Planctomycetaceae bacterium]
MSKKIFSAFTLVAFMLAMSVAAYAVNVSAKLDGNGAKASLSVTADGVTLTNQAWANNAAAIYRIGDHDVSVAIKGNKVDKVAYVGKAPEVPQGDEGAEIVDVFATPAPVAAVAFNALANPDEPVVESKVNATTPLASLKGAGFHCNADGKFGEDGYFVSQGGGKGRVWPSLPAPWGEVKNVNNSVYLYLSSVPGTTKWDLDDIFDVKTGVSMGLPVCPNCGSTLWVSYSNNSGIPDGKNVQFQHPPKGDDDGKLLGAPSLTKTVDGQFFAEWAVDNDVDVFEILASISFKAYAVDGEGADFDRDAPFAVGELDLNGVITFVPNEFPAGWYAIVEEYVPGSYAEEIFEEVNDPLYVEIGASGKIVGGGNFDYQGVYVMANEPGDKMWLTPAMTIGGHPVYDFHVRNVATGEQISSFCAAADVLHGTGAEEMKEQKFENKDEVIKMLNYIYDNYGSIDQWPKPGDCEGFKFYGSDDPHFAQWNTPNGERYGTKLIAQLCLGALLGDGSPALVDNVGSDRVIASAINSAVADVLANFATATVGNNIIDVVYLAKNEEIGWNDPQPQLVPVYAPTFNNTPKNPGGEKGTLSLTKTVDGVFIAEWAFDKGYDFDEVMEILAGISFVATSVDTGETFQSGPVEPSGQILFDDVPAGWYKVEEVLTGLAADIFENVGPKYFYVDKDGVFGETTFDYDAYYTIVNGHGSGYTLGYGGLNNSGDIFPIHVDNAVTGERFASFCANAGSTNFAEGHANYYVAGSFSDYLAYYVANGVDIGHFLSAYNYIEDNYGNLDDLRPVTQIVTWALLGELGGKGIDHNTDAFNDINWAAIAAGSPGVPGVANAK